jgi:hypothetical protein
MEIEKAVWRRKHDNTVNAYVVVSLLLVLKRCSCPNCAWCLDRGVLSKSFKIVRVVM